ncbi:VIT1/CCC1 transporter family protein [Desulfogranum marinum]|uniref:VIT1/CCC1 transporter family protein n=1 Tax=Desulfogranum marinum TaxID=453220 RepID=UPI001966CCA1|nr:VIT1/CCC1 transporter family protein [Desulfogranum marinum]MBM9511592.1 hypothetical protein [Desulfogranum marinum]
MIENKKYILLHISRAKAIARRYFVTNGFDGALTMLGMVTGFHISGMQELTTAISACVGASIALFVSGSCSAYLSEKAEREKELQEIEQALVSELKESYYGEAKLFIPIFVALVNGLSPLLFSLVIIIPIFLAEHGYLLPLPPFICSIVVALVCIFLLGVFLGRISKKFWLWSGISTLLIALVTIAVIIFLGGTYDI